MPAIPATIGASALVLLLAWLAHAILCERIARRKGDSERLGLALGLTVPAPMEGAGGVLREVMSKERYVARRQLDERSRGKSRSGLTACVAAAS